jgi:hypothetical protein
VGVDAVIYFESDGQPSDLWLPGDREILDAEDKYGPRYDGLEGATHRVGTYDRYYNKGYERGSWPAIGGILMALLASKNVKRVWYFGDNCEGADLITIDGVLEISRHYMLNGERPYREGAERVT